MTVQPTYYPQMQYVPAPVPRRPTSGLAVAALITAIVALMLGWLFFGLPCIPAIVLGHLAVSDTRPDSGRSGRAMAVVALALGYPGLVLAVAVTVATLAPFL